MSGTGTAPTNVAAARLNAAESSMAVARLREQLAAARVLPHSLSRQARLPGPPTPSRLMDPTHCFLHKIRPCPQSASVSTLVSGTTSSSSSSASVHSPRLQRFNSCAARPSSAYSSVSVSSAALSMYSGFGADGRRLRPVSAHSHPSPRSGSDLTHRVHDIHSHSVFNMVEDPLEVVTVVRVPREELGAKFAGLDEQAPIVIPRDMMNKMLKTYEKM